MKENIEYKNAALDALKGNWAPAVLCSVVYIAILSILVAPNEICSAKLAVLPSLAFGLAGGTVLVSLFLISVLEIGFVNAFRCLLVQGNSDLLYNTFHIGFWDYIHKVWTYFLMNLKIALWTLLFIIPGLIKSFAYAMTPFIIAENPQMSAKEAIAMSKRMMSGRKFDLFYLYLSMAGWFVLSILTLGVGFLWLIPYTQTAVASFYEDVKEDYKTKYNE